MPSHPESRSSYLLQRPHWFFVGGAVVAAVVALVAEGPGDYVGLVLLLVSVAAICSWSLSNKPTLYCTVAIVASALLLLGWTVEDPEPALFQSILITAAVGWRVQRLSTSLFLLVVLALVPLLGSLGQGEEHWGWWNWSVGTLLTWSLGRVIRLLELTLNELTEARSQLIDSAAREERLRISRDVHDLVGHSLTAMLLNIRAAQRSLEKDSKSARQALADAEQIGTTGMSDIRTALVDLRNDSALDKERSEPLSSLPDGDAIEKLLQQQSHITISTHGPVGQLKGPVSVAIYRILQECITNCSRHAREGTATIALDIRNAEVILTSRNSIAGTHAGKVCKPEKSIGLISMRERVNSLGGSFSAGANGDCWKLDCRIPLNG